MKKRLYQYVHCSNQYFIIYIYLSNYLSNKRDNLKTFLIYQNCRCWYLLETMESSQINPYKAEKQQTTLFFNIMNIYLITHIDSKYFPFLAILTFDYNVFILIRINILLDISSKCHENHHHRSSQESWYSFFTCWNNHCMSTLIVDPIYTNVYGEQPNAM
jgi:hypothetical protein